MLAKFGTRGRNLGFSVYLVDRVRPRPTCRHFWVDVQTNGSFLPLYLILNDDLIVCSHKPEQSRET